MDVYYTDWILWYNFYQTVYMDANNFLEKYRHIYVVLYHMYFLQKYI